MAFARTLRVRMPGMSERPFKILGIQQIAVGGLDKQPMREFWIDTLGESHRNGAETISCSTMTALLRRADDTDPPVANHVEPRPASERSSSRDQQ